MHVSVIYNTSCNQTDYTDHSCIDYLITELREFGLNLRAEKVGDSVNGGLVLTHFPNGHLAEIEIYTKNEKPNKEHSGNFIKCTKTPKQIENKIGQLYPKDVPSNVLKIAITESDKNMPSRIKGIQY
jgi:hypothetical protein